MIFQRKFIYIASLVPILAGLALYGPRLISGAANPIQIENLNAGTRGWEPSNPVGNREIEGYASLTSVNAGDDISFLVSTSDSRFTLTVYRLGYYQGLGGRQMTAPVTLNGIAQPMPAPDPVTGMVECDWNESYRLAIPSDWVSGLYVAKIKGTSSGKDGLIGFVVRNDGRAADLMFQSSVTTAAAYNAWGGKSLYDYNSEGEIPAVKVSFNRPYDDSYGAGEILSWELNMAAFLEKEGYDVVYSTDVDTHTSPNELLLHKAFLSVGHDEYWSWEMRENVTAARDQGVNLGFFSANSIYWQIRFEPSPVTGAADRTIVGYKDLWELDPAAGKPSTYHLVTNLWRDDKVTLPANPEDALIGVMYSVEPVDGDIVVAEPSHWVFANTGLKKGSALKGLLGYEVDRIFDEDAAIDGLVDLAHSPFSFEGETQYSDMTVYTAESGATVFATGSIQWSFGLSDVSPWGPSPSRVNAAAQQITRNVLAQFIDGSIGSSPTPSATATPTASKTSSRTPTPIATPTVAATATATPTATLTVTPTASPTVAPTLTATPTSSPSVAPTQTPSTPTASLTPALTRTSTAVPTPTIPPTIIPSATPTAATVQITAPASGASVSGTVSLALQKTSSVVWINVYIDGRYLVSTPPLTLSWNSATVANGAHTISATAYSSSGTVLGSASVSVAVQNGGGTPTATATPGTAIQITAPANGASVSGTVNVVVQKASNVSWVNLYVDGRYTASSPPFTFSWNSTTVANGSHAISANAYSSAGAQLGTASVTLTVQN